MKHFKVIFTDNDEMVIDAEQMVVTPSGAVMFANQAAPNVIAVIGHGSYAAIIEIAEDEAEASK